MNAEEWAERFSAHSREAREDGFTVEVSSCGECYETATLVVYDNRPRTDDFAEIEI